MWTIVPVFMGHLRKHTFSVASGHVNKLHVSGTRNATVTIETIASEKNFLKRPKSGFKRKDNGSRFKNIPNENIEKQSLGSSLSGAQRSRIEKGFSLNPNSVELLKREYLITNSKEMYLYGT